MDNQESESEVLVERKRCEDIVQLARSGEIDGDFRTIIHFIRSGRSVEEIRGGQ